MLKEIIRHKIAYTILVVGLTAFTLAFMAAWPNHALQQLLAGGLAVFYFAWGVTTHLHAEHISKKIVLEYLGVSTLAGFLLFLISM